MTFQERLLWAFFIYQSKQRPVRVITHPELAEMVGREMGGVSIHQTTVSRWFTESFPSRPTMAALARVLGVDVGWLAYGEGEPPDDRDGSEPDAMPRPTARK